MPKSIIVEGKTTNEALEKGLKELNVSKNMVEIKQIEEEKRSFYSILTPRIVKLELTLKENCEKVEKKERIKKETVEDPENVKIAEKRVKEFLNKFLSSDIKFETKIENSTVLVNIKGENINYLIGYRGETANAIQTILSIIANKEKNSRVKIFLDIGGYKEKRIKTLEDLADKVAKTVIRTGKAITLEPMTAYERKIIHVKLQENNKVKTFSKGEEPYRRLVIDLK